MSGSRQTTKPTYKVEVEEEAWEGLSSLPESQQEKVLTLWRDHLGHHPTQRIPGKLKRLKGEYHDFFQYDISQSQRMIYSVDEESRTVYVEYIGKHPDWKRHQSRAW